MLETLRGHRTIIAAWLAVLVLAAVAVLGIDLTAIGVAEQVTFAEVAQAGWAAIIVTFLRKGMDNALEKAKEED